MAFFDNLFGKGKSFSDRMRYVNDFKTEEYRNARGKLRTRAVYIGPWTVLTEPGGKTLAKLIGTAILAGAAAASLVYAFLQMHTFGGDLLVMIPLYAALLPLFYLLTGVFSLPYRQNPMRRDQYMHGIRRMQRSSVAVLAFIGVGVIASFVLRLGRNDWLFLKGDIRFLAGCGVSVLCLAAILSLLGCVDIAERPNSAYPNS